MKYKLSRPFSFVCNKPDFSPAGKELSLAIWCGAVPVTQPLPLSHPTALSDISPYPPMPRRVYYAQKFLEFGDTVFFVVRKSFRQVTFLHIYHHVSITLVVRWSRVSTCPWQELRVCVSPPLSRPSIDRRTLIPPLDSLLSPTLRQTAAFIRFDVNGDDYLAALVNSFVHVLMYSHYLLAAFKVWEAAQQNCRRRRGASLCTIFCACGPAPRRVAQALGAHAFSLVLRRRSTRGGSVSSLRSSSSSSRWCLRRRVGFGGRLPASCASPALRDLNARLTRTSTSRRLSTRTLLGGRTADRRTG